MTVWAFTPNDREVGRWMIPQGPYPRGRAPQHDVVVRAKELPALEHPGVGPEQVELESKVRKRCIMLPKVVSRSGSQGFQARFNAST